MPTTPERDGRSASLSTLCLACGLCCDGNLFTQVPLEAAEAARLRRRGLVVLARDDGTEALRQRCAALEGRRCAVYEARPAGCRRHVCLLHAARTADELTQAEALEVVGQAQALLAAVDAALPPGPGAVMQRARQALHEGRASEAARAAFEAARRYLGRQFQRDV